MYRSPITLLCLIPILHALSWRVEIVENGAERLYTITSLTVDINHSGWGYKVALAREPISLEENLKQFRIDKVLNISTAFDNIYL
jgi:hypothetical protein